MFTLMFWRATAERAISTAAQTAVGLLGADGLGVLDVDWGDVASVSALSAALAVLKALAASQLGNSASPSLVDAEVLPSETARFGWGDGIRTTDPKPKGKG